VGKRAEHTGPRGAKDKLKKRIGHGSRCFMDLDIKRQFADLLRAAASQTISEQDFWDKFKKLELPVKNPFSRAAYNAAIHF
jgi:hypothetical protein